MAKSKEVTITDKNGITRTVRQPGFREWINPFSGPSSSSKPLSGKPGTQFGFSVDNSTNSLTLSRALDNERIKNKKKVARETKKKEREAQKADQARQRRREREAKGPTPFQENVIFDQKMEAHLLGDGTVRIHTTTAGVQHKEQKKGVAQKSNVGESGGRVKHVEILEQAQRPNPADLSSPARALRHKLQADERKRAGTMSTTVFEGKPIESRDPNYTSPFPTSAEIASGKANLGGMQMMGAIVRAIFGK